MADLSFQTLDADRLGDYLDFFEHRAFTDNPRWASCYCYFPLHDPRTMRWETRTAAENRTAVTTSIAARHLNGVLAYAGGQVVGWCNAGPWSQFPMLRDVPEAHATTTGAIMCFVVAPTWRGKGVASGLLKAACDALRAGGMTAVRARAVRSADAAKNHFGPLAMYLAVGFEVTRDADGAVFVQKTLG
jgi:GNAT superfamily N-acetyltransferase